MSMNNGKKLAGKIAVITGGSSGMALASAKRFVEEGAYVFSDRREWPRGVSILGGMRV
jgi:NAD(P)-dependent dehydrogenase (short-subunit alcohol dehydrogenase family)